MSAAYIFAAQQIACRTRVSGTRQHRILSSYPSHAFVSNPTRNTLIDRSRTSDTGIAHDDQRRAFRIRQKVGPDICHANFVGGSSVSACEAHRVPRFPRPRELKVTIQEISPLL